MYGLPLFKRLVSGDVSAQTVTYWGFRSLTSAWDMIHSVTSSSCINIFVNEK